MQVEAAMTGGIKRKRTRDLLGMSQGSAKALKHPLIGSGSLDRPWAGRKTDGRVWPKALCTSVATLLVAAGLASPTAGAQQVSATPQPSSTPQTGVLLQPTLSELRSTIAGLRIAKWKAPVPVKEEAQGNAGSIDRDLENTLPGLISQADTPPQSVANSFVVYRNLDALYEVLLRVSSTAELAASDEEAANVAHSLLTLDAARRALGDSIVTSSRSQEAALAMKAQQPASAGTAPPTAAQTNVVNDGPAAAPSHRSKPKVKPKAAPAATPQS